MKNSTKCGNGNLWNYIAFHGLWGNISCVTKSKCNTSNIFAIKESSGWKCGKINVELSIYSSAQKYCKLKLTFLKTTQTEWIQKLILGIDFQICIFNISKFGRRKWNLPQTAIHSHYHSVKRRNMFQRGLLFANFPCAAFWEEDWLGQSQM